MPVTNELKSPDCVQKAPLRRGTVFEGGRAIHGASADLQLRVLQCATARIVGWDHANLAAPYWRLYLMEGAGAAVRWAGRTVPLRADRAWLIAPDTPFGAILRRPVTQCYVHFTLAASLAAAPGVYAMRRSDELRTWHARAVAARSPEAGGIAWHALALAALAGLPPGTLAERRTDARVARAILAMERDVGAAHTLETVAAEAGMHARSLIRLFRAETGCTPMAWLRARRVALACELLHHGDRKIDDIATAAGFCDRYHFTKVFRRLRGVAPAAYRNAGRAGAV